MFLAVDGGATKTVAVLYDESDGLLKGLGISGPSNLTSAGPSAARQNIKLAVDQALQNASLGINSVDGGIFGIAGIGDSKDLTSLANEMIDSLTGRSDFVKLNDGVPAYTLANLFQDGIVFAGGTGSVAFYRQNNSLNRIGGWNWFVGDDGSASWIAKRALNLATFEYDGLFEGNELVKSVENYFGGEFREVIAYLDQHQDKRRIAGFASIVSGMAENGYSRAMQIFEESASYVRTLIQATKSKFQGNPKISLVGGTMLAGKKYIELITGEMRENVEVFYGYQVAVGGLLLLLKDHGMYPTYELRDRILGQLERQIRGKNKAEYEKFLNTVLK